MKRKLTSSLMVGIGFGLASLLNPIGDTNGGEVQISSSASESPSLRSIELYPDKERPLVRLGIFFPTNGVYSLLSSSNLDTWSTNQQMNVKYPKTVLYVYDNYNTNKEGHFYRVVKH